MKIVLSEAEINNIYKFASGLSNPEANKIFNAMFSQHHSEMIQHQLDSEHKTLSLIIDEDITNIFLEAFVNNASNMSSLFGSNKMTILCTAKTVFQKLSSDIKVAVSIATRVWNRVN
jgi:hypothetical protein